MKTKFILILLQISMWSSTSNGEPTEHHCMDDDYQYSIGSDASPWAMNGYSILYSSLSGNCRLVLEAWQIEFPKVITDLNPENKGSVLHTKNLSKENQFTHFYLFTLRPDRAINLSNEEVKGASFNWKSSKTYWRKYLNASPLG